MLSVDCHGVNSQKKEKERRIQMISFSLFLFFQMVDAAKPARNIKKGEISESRHVFVFARWTKCKKNAKGMHINNCTKMNL